MDYAQVFAASAARCDDLKRKDLKRLCIGSSLGDPLAARIVESIQAEIRNCCAPAIAISVGSFGYYNLEPMVLVDKPGESIVAYGNVTPETAGTLVNDCREDLISSIVELPFCRLEKRIALRNCGRIDPRNLDQYILLAQGYVGLAKALKMSPGDAILDIRKSKLRGRGGAGFRAADKWAACRNVPEDRKYVICNAAESDPYARNARLLLEGDPHSVIEGMLIAANAVGASQGIMCVNADYGAAMENLEHIFGQMRAHSLLGSNILNSSFSFEITIRSMPAAFVSGEESALVRCLEGKQPMPYLRPPFPAYCGFSGTPTLIHSAETLSNVSAIFQKDPEWFSDTGTDESKGTKVMTLCGNDNLQYTVEIPFGISLSRIVEAATASGLAERGIKAVQFGGPTGCLIPADSLDTPVAYESMDSDFIMGSATLRVFDTKTCAVEMTRDIVSYIQGQSCGQCVFCREGCHQMLDILQDISENRGKPQDLDLLIELSRAMRLGSICGLGRTAPNPILSSIRLFRSEYDAHIVDKRCLCATSPLN